MEHPETLEIRWAITNTKHKDQSAQFRGHRKALDASSRAGVSQKTAAIIVNWNSGSLLEQCIFALQRQTVRLDKIVVVDNASKDGSLELVEKHYPEIALTRLKENMGFAAANNLAVAHVADCHWITLVNPDAFPEPEWLEKLMEAAQAYPVYSSYASRMLLNEDRTRLDGAGDVYHTSGGAWRRGHNQATHKSDFKKGEVFGACAGAALYRRDAFLDVGGFDEGYFCYFEDVDLAFRLRLAGYRCLYVPEAVVHHVGSATMGERSDFTTYHGQRNLVWTYFKDMPWPLFWLYLPQHLLLNMAMLVWYSVRGQAWVIWKAKWDALKGLPRILRERRRVQATRCASAWTLRHVMAKGLLTPYLWRQNQ
ncbi:MAG: glycosyltransferase family 2 protein [Acidiferrobacterales bacterium]